MTAGKVDFDCPVCGSSRITQIYGDTLGDALPEFGYNFGQRHGAHYRIVRCDNCTHAYCTPRHPDMFRNYIDVEDIAYLKHQEQRIATALRVISRITRYKDSGRLLDIGCSTGDFLNVAKRSFSVEGLDLSGWAADAAQRRGLLIHRKQLTEFEPDTPYDVITLWGVIEHFEFPLRELTEMDRLLKANPISPPSSAACWSVCSPYRATMPTPRPAVATCSPITRPTRSWPPPPQQPSPRLEPMSISSSTSNVFVQRTHRSSN